MTKHFVSFPEMHLVGKKDDRLISILAYMLILLSPSFYTSIVMVFELPEHYVLPFYRFPGAYPLTDSPTGVLFGLLFIVLIPTILISVNVLRKFINGYSVTGMSVYDHNRYVERYMNQVGPYYPDLNEFLYMLFFMPYCPRLFMVPVVFVVSMLIHVVSFGLSELTRSFSVFGLFIAPGLIIVVCAVYFVLTMHYKNNKLLFENSFKNV
jgi:hypothetical protein